MFSNSSFLSSGDTNDFSLPLAPTVDAGLDGSVAKGFSHQLNATVIQNAGSDLIINWTSDRPGTFNNPNIEDPTFVADETGAYVLTITVTTSNTSPINDILNLTVTTPIAPTVDAGGPYSVDFGNSVQLNAVVTINDGNNISYQWSANQDGTFNNPNIEDPTFTPNDGGNYTLTLTISTSNTPNASDTASLAATGAFVDSSARRTFNGQVGGSSAGGFIPYTGLTGDLAICFIASADPVNNTLNAGWNYLYDSVQINSLFYTVATFVLPDSLGGDYELKSSWSTYSMTGTVVIVKGSDNILLTSTSTNDVATSITPTKTSLYFQMSGYDPNGPIGAGGTYDPLLDFISLGSYDAGPNDPHFVLTTTVKKVTANVATTNYFSRNNTTATIAVTVGFA